MAVGDEHGLTEDLYHQLIGRYVATIEVLSKRIVAKDQYIARLETEASMYDSKVARLEKEAIEKISQDAEEGDFLVMDESPVLIKKPKGKK